MATTRNESEETQQLTYKGPSDLEIQKMVTKQIGENSDVQKEMNEMTQELVHQVEYTDLVYVGVFLIWTVLFGIWVFDKNAACGEVSLHTFAVAAFWTSLALTLLYVINTIMAFSAEKNIEVLGGSTSYALGCVAFFGVLMLVIWGFIILFTMTNEAGCEGLYYLTFIYPIFLVCFTILTGIIGYFVASSTASKHLGALFKS